MKFKFKIQQYQTDAVENTVNVFKGQPCLTPDNQTLQYRRDKGQAKQAALDLDSDLGYRNAELALNTQQLLENIHESQNNCQIPNSQGLVEDVGKLNLDIEMETGTGKTYVYIKTMFELYKRYGWSKFIIVVPSIAIREGVKKSFEVLEGHFMELYGKKARYFIYDSKNLHLLDSFSSSSSLSVMIINTQAFATSLNEGGRAKESRIIYEERDEFQSRRPIDVIAANRPIIIRDEPQKMEGPATKAALKKFNPLFVLNYSATHQKKHNAVYALDALDAYKQKLVKRIQVKGIEVKNLPGTHAYLYLDKIVLSPTEAPKVSIELDIKSPSGTKRVTRTFEVGDKLYVVSELNAYKNFVIDEINPIGVGSVSFTNGVVLEKGEVLGDSSEATVQRVQIRETILSHLEKEQALYRKGIKCLSLFFIDSVAKYKSYDAEGNVVKGSLQTIFEEEYQSLVKSHEGDFDQSYANYLKRFRADEVHNGYFSIDNKGHLTDGKAEKKPEWVSDDISAYDLILKDKERLLSFDEPTRFIFSHSALREGWDNPNVFQICMLRHSNSETAKRQEVGRGLRLCVDQNGVRMDRELLGDEVHEVNQLTVVSNESYASFTKALQEETKDVLRERQTKVTNALFVDRTVVLDGSDYKISESDASRIRIYLEDNEYVDSNGNLTKKYHDEKKAGCLAALPSKIAKLGTEIEKVLDGVSDTSDLKELTTNGLETTIPEQKLNERFQKEEFQRLWNEINHKYVYRVSYDSNELIQKVVDSLNASLKVNKLRYVKVEGVQSKDDVLRFGDVRSSSEEISGAEVTSLKYDVVGDIAKVGKVTRKTVVEILTKITPSKFALFQANPEEFIKAVARHIQEQKATMVVEHIEYDVTNETFDSDIFTSSPAASMKRSMPVKKHITDYLVADSDGERRFAQDMDAADEVVVYAKLPRSFKIPTPVGNYAPDWAIAFDKNKVKHIFFVAETKGSMDSTQLRQVEEAKISCARRLFDELPTHNVRYGVINSFEELRNLLIEE